MVGGDPFEIWKIRGGFGDWSAVGDGSVGSGAIHDFLEI